MLYKITGVWGNHEGSLVLWVLILALFGLASVACSIGANLPATASKRNVCLPVQALDRGRRFCLSHHHRVESVSCDSTPPRFDGEGI